MSHALVNSKKNVLPEKKKSIFFVIYIFLVLFSPPIIADVNLILILAAYSLLALIIRYRSEAMSVFAMSGMKSLFVGVGIYYLYCAIVVMISIVLGGAVQGDHYIRMLYSFFLLSPVTFVCVLYILVRAKKLGYNLVNLMEVFVYAGLLQAILAVLALLLPEVKTYFVDQMFLNTSDPLLNTPWVTNIRYFGFANSMLDLFGVGMGIIAALTLFLAVKKTYWYFILFPIILVSCLLNARSGLLIAAVGFVFFILYLISKMWTYALFKTVIIAIIGLIFIVTIGLRLLGEYAPDTINWAARDISSFVGSEGAQDGTASALFSSNFWQLPNLLGILVGTGHTLYQARGYAHSDVGYINDLWRTGLIGMALLYIPFIAMMRKSINWMKDKLASILAVYFAIVMALFLIKGSIWVYSPGIVVILSLLLFAITLKYDQVKNVKAGV